MKWETWNILAGWILGLALIATIAWGAVMASREVKELRYKPEAMPDDTRWCYAAKSSDVGTKAEVCWRSDAEAAEKIQRALAVSLAVQR